MGTDIRPVRVVNPLTDVESEGPTCLIVRVRFSNSDGTLNTGSAYFHAPGVIDEFGNVYGHHTFSANSRSGEPHEHTGLGPDMPAKWVFVFQKPVPNATRFKFAVTGILKGVEIKEFAFPFAVTIPNPEREAAPASRLPASDRPGR